MFKKLLIFGFWLWASAASAQTMCPTRPSGDSSNACASTAFINDPANGIFALPHTWSALQTFSVIPVIPGLPGLSDSVLGTGVPGMANGHWFISGRPSTFDNLNALRLERYIPTGTTGLSPNNTYMALWAHTQSPESNIGSEWTILADFDNYALGTGGAQNAALSSVIVKKSASGEVGYSAGGHMVCRDEQGRANPNYGCLGAEIGASANSATTDNNNVRNVLLLNAGGVGGSWIGSGLRIGTNAGVNLVRGITFDGGAGTYYTGLDLSGQTFNITPIGCAAGQCLGLDADPATKVVNRKLYYASGLLVYAAVGSPVLTVTDSGNLSLAGLIKTTALAVGSLPTCNAGAKASRLYVTDANQTLTAGIGAIVAGGGANNVPVGCDGTNWRIGG